MSLDTSLRSAQRTAPGSEAHAVAMARAGRWVEAERLYRELRDQARQDQWTCGLEREALPISETRGPVVSERARDLKARYKGLMLNVRRFSRARADAERRAKGAK